MLNESANLTGKLLLAMPGMGDPRFDGAVIFMCSHTDDGAMGLIINKPAQDIQFTDLLTQLDITPTDPSRDIRVHFGGPVEMGRGFVLHDQSYVANDTTLKVGNDFAMTATLDVVEDIAHGNGPDTSLLALGYAGWGPGQLETEIRANGWLTCDAPVELVFDDDNTCKWGKGLETLGINPLMLSAVAGDA